MPNPQLTDERLRSWLDTQQLAQERLCQAVLSLDRRFRNVRSRSPRGGRDGGRDLEATFQDGREAWAGIGFQNSVSDSPEEKKSCARKIKQDTDRAAKATKNVKVFVAFTNVALTVGEKQALVDYGRERGLHEIDIFDRERIRIHLDSPDGLGIRFQYLGIALSDAEQAAFFGRWGTTLESLISSSVTSLENRLCRLEFSARSAAALGTLTYHLRFQNPIPVANIGHFRVDFVIKLPKRGGGKQRNRFRDHEYQSLHLAICDARNKTFPIPFGHDEFVWIDNGHPLGMGNLRPDAPLEELFGGLSSYDMEEHLEGVKLSDLDGASFTFVMNEALPPVIEEVFIVANDYLVFHAGRHDLESNACKYRTIWPGPLLQPIEFSEDELNQQWVELVPKHRPATFDFSRDIPVLISRPQALQLPPFRLQRYFD